MTNSKHTGQSDRMLAHLQAHPNMMVEAVLLHRIGSGKDGGYCGSLSRRISDIRKRGYTLVKSKDATVDGQRQTGYTLVVESGNEPLICNFCGKVNPIDVQFCECGALPKEMHHVSAPVRPR